MNVLATEYSLAHQALEVYLAGCKGPHCEGCHNPESWSFNQGDHFKEVVPSLLEKARSRLVKWVWVLGGEPLDQDLEALEELLYHLAWVRKPLMLFTRYSAVKVCCQSFSPLLTFVKTGPYCSALRPRTVTHTDNDILRVELPAPLELASWNQRVLRI